MASITIFAILLAITGNAVSHIIRPHNYPQVTENKFQENIPQNVHSLEEVNSRTLSQASTQQSEYFGISDKPVPQTENNGVDDELITILTNIGVGNKSVPQFENNDDDQESTIQPEKVDISYESVPQSENNDDDNQESTIQPEKVDVRDKSVPQSESNDDDNQESTIQPEKVDVRDKSVPQSESNDDDDQESTIQPEKVDISYESVPQSENNNDNQESTIQPEKVDVRDKSIPQPEINNDDQELTPKSQNDDDNQVSSTPQPTNDNSYDQSTVSPKNDHYAPEPVQYGRYFDYFPPRFPRRDSRIHGCLFPFKNSFYDETGIGWHTYPEDLDNWDNPLQTLYPRYKKNDAQALGPHRTNPTMIKNHLDLWDIIDSW